MLRHQVVVLDVEYDAADTSPPAGWSWQSLTDSLGAVEVLASGPVVARGAIGGGWGEEFDDPSSPLRDDSGIEMQERGL